MKTIPNFDLSYMNNSINIRRNALHGIYDNCHLRTALQPVYSLAHKRIVGYEALLRIKDKKENNINPAYFFESKKDISDTIFLDRLARYIHLHNFTTINDDINWLFLNVTPQTILKAKEYGPFFKELLEEYNFPAHRVVIEVVEHPINDNSRLLDIINFYKELGCLIAIDDFGAGHSNFDRIWTLKPDIVKLDRSFLVKASREKSVENMLPGIVSLLHQAGSFVLMEGIETTEQALMAIESNADFVQGYYFGRPTTELDKDIKNFTGFESLFADYKKISETEDLKLRSTLKKYSSFFDETILNLKKGSSFNLASTKLINEKSVLRCYQLKSNGVQVGKTVISKDLKLRINSKFKPLEDAKSADWFRRHYLKRAILHPNQIQITRPYLSITGAEMCVTLSMMFNNTSNEANILCCDIAL